MARYLKKRSSVTRRTLLKAAVAGTIASFVGPTGKISHAQSVENQQAASIWRSYSLTMSLNVPKIFNNEHSTGSRKYQIQRITGTLMLGFNNEGDLVDVQFKDMLNKTHKLPDGSNVTYEARLDYDAYFPRFNAIGSNMTNIFKTATICFSMIAEPSYNIGELNEDTSLYISLAGKGTMNALGQLKAVQGYVAGTMGCGCQAYGHTSPTRTIGYNGATSQVTDVAAVFGNWRIKPSHT